jgi:ferrous iron transport protein A
MMHREIRNLGELRNGTHALVHHLRGGKEFINRLLVLGFTIGTEVVVMQNSGGGPILIAVRDSRIALGRGETQKIVVEVLSRG